MASGVMHSSLECSSSGRGSISPYARLANPRSRANVFPTAPVSVTGPAPIHHWSTTRLVQPPLSRQRLAGRYPEPPRVSQQEDGQKTKKKRRISLVQKIRSLQAEYGIPNAIDFSAGLGNLPNVILTHPQTGMKLVVYLYGATIAQWLKINGTATFYDGPYELYQKGMPLRTGVSVHFPQHRDGLLPEHGFADSMMWEVVESGFDTPEVADQWDTHCTKLMLAGLLTEKLVERATSGDEEAGRQVMAVMKEHPPRFNVTTDMAPYVILRLRDTATTREMWPHRFELEYKITLETMHSVTPAEERELLMMAGLDPDNLPSEDDLQVVRMGDDGEGEEGEDGEGEELEVDVASTRGEAGGGSDDEEEEQAASPKRRRGRPPKNPRPEDEATGDAGAVAAADEGEDEDEDGVEVEEEEGEEGAVSPIQFVPPVQVRQEFWVRNRDPPRSPPMEFNLASLARFVTMQQPDHSDWIKVLGLGGSQVFDYTADPRFPNLDLMEEDFLHFTGHPIDATFVDAADATVYFCPGNRTHFEFIQREGFKDMFVEQPTIDENPDFLRAAAIGTGYIASTRELAPGEEWHAESIIRFHDRYLTPPVFGDDAMAPLPPLSPADIMSGADMESQGEGEGGDAYEDLPSDPSTMVAGTGE